MKTRQGNKKTLLWQMNSNSLPIGRCLRMSAHKRTHSACQYTNGHITFRMSVHHRTHYIPHVSTPSDTLHSACQYTNGHTTFRTSVHQRI